MDMETFFREVEQGLSKVINGVLPEENTGDVTSLYVPVNPVEDVEIIPEGEGEALLERMDWEGLEQELERNLLLTSFQGLDTLPQDLLENAVHFAMPIDTAATTSVDHFAMPIDTDATTSAVNFTMPIDTAAATSGDWSVLGPSASGSFLDEQSSQDSAPDRTPSPIIFTESIGQPSGLASIFFLDRIKAVVARVLLAVITEQQEAECYGCLTNHPSQRHHPCLYRPPKFFMFLRFDELVRRLFTGRLLPAISRVLESQGVLATQSRIQGICEAFLYDLRGSEDINETLVSTLAEIDFDNKKEILDEVITFWKGPLITDH